MASSSSKAKRKLDECHNPSATTSYLQKFNEGDITRKTLNALLKRLKEGTRDEVDHLTQWHLDIACGARLQGVRHVEAIILDCGKHFDWELCNPNLLLASIVAYSERMQELCAGGQRTAFRTMEIGNRL